MIRRFCLLMVLLASAACARNAPERGTAGNAASPPEGAAVQANGDEQAATRDWKVEYDEMVASLKLTDEEAAPVKAAFQARELAVNAWVSEKGEQLKELERKMLAAAKSRDLARMSSFKQQAEPLRDEFRGIVEKHRDNIRNALPTSRQLEWDAHQLSERVLKMMESLKLSDEQISKIRTDAVAVARDSAAEKNPQAAGFLKLERTTETSVLTPEQRQAYEPVKKKNSLRSLK